MIEWIKIYDHHSTDEDFVRRVKVNGKTVCLIKYRDRFFATQTKCPHAGADLSYGWCKDGRLVCPYHRHQFDLQTGEGANGQGDYIHVYPLERRDDGIYIGLKRRTNFFKRIFG